MKSDNNWINFKTIRLLFFFWGLIFCNQTQYSQTKLPDPVVFGSDSNFPPYEFLDKNGEATGFDVDLMKAIADEMGFKVVFKLGIWAEIKKEFENDETIHVSDMFYSEERDKLFDYAIPHEITFDKIFVHKGNRKIFSISDLANKNVAVYAASTLEEYLITKHPEINLIPVPSEPEALILLSKGKCDAAIISKIAHVDVINKYNLNNIIEVGQPYFLREFAFVVKEGNSHLLKIINTGIIRLKQNGKFNKIHEKWFGKKEESWISKNLISVLSIMFGIVVFLILISISFRFIIKRKTKELELSYSRLKFISNAKASRIDKLSPKEHTQELLSSLKDAFQVDACIVRIIENNELKLWGYIGVDEKILPENIPLNFGLGKKIIAEKKAISMPSHTLDKENLNEIRKIHNLANFIVLAGAPLFIEDNIIGIISIYSNKKDIVFSEIDLEHLQIVANQLGISIENSILFEQNNHQKELLLEQIASRQKAEETLKASEEKFKLAFHTSPDSINITKFDGTYVDINEGFTALSGFTKEDVIGKTSTELNIWVDTKDRDKLVNGLKTEGRYSNLEAKFRMKNGDIIIGLMSASVISLNNVNHILTITRNITEIKKAQNKLEENEARLRVAFDNSAVGMCLTALNGSFLQVNTKICQILGYSAKELLSLTFQQLTHPDDISKSIEFVNNWLEGKETKYNFEKRYLKKNGDTIWAEVSSALLRDKNNAPVHFITQIVDITERKTTNEKIKKLNETLEHRVIERTAQLEVTNKELEAFSYSISHDLRAPLRSIDGFSQAILEDYYDLLDTQGKNFLDRIRSSAQMMAKLIDDMLKLSRVTRSPIKFTQVNLSEIAESIKNELLEQDINRKVKFVIEPYINEIADPTLIRAAIYNLFENAWKFTSKKEEAKIEFGIFDNNENHTYFIKDNGAGFDMKYSDKLFTTFQRLHQQTEFPGTGIGLATVQRIIHRHNGRVWAEGKVNEGAIFYFTLKTQDEVC